MLFLVNYLNPFFWLVCIRRFLYQHSVFRSQQLPGVKVISIGNIEVGGTGKTPFVIATAHYLKQKGFNPLILSRGYGSKLKSKDFAWIKNGRVFQQSSNELAKESNLFADEAMLCSFYLPEVWILIGSKRYRNFTKFIQEVSDLKQNITHVILEDGFQHLRIKRDLDILLLTESSLSDKSLLLPFGRLRESLNQIKQADFCLWTGSKDNFAYQQKLSQLKHGVALLNASNFEQVFFVKKDEQSASLKNLTRDDISLFCAKKKWIGLFGIAKSHSLVQSLKESFQVNFLSLRFKRDHQAFSQADKLWVEEFLNDNNTVLVTTLKDYFRQPEFFDVFPFEACLFIDKSFLQTFSSSSELERLRIEVLGVD